MTEIPKYNDIAESMSRRRYVKDMTKKHGLWFPIRLDANASSRIRTSAYQWCGELQVPWGCDQSQRRFYFSKMDHAIMFKLAFGGKS